MFALWKVGRLDVTRFKYITVATFTIKPLNIYYTISWLRFDADALEWYKMKAYELCFYVLPLYVN